MKAMVYYGPNDIQITEVDKPSINSKEVLVKIKSTGICGSDIHGYLGTTGRRIPPLIMGHEFTGIVQEIGNNVEGFSQGDRVAVFPVVFCGECKNCKRGMIHICANRKIFGVLKFNGSFTEYIAVPAENLFKLPDNLSFEQGALSEPIAVAVRAVNQAGPLEGKNVLIVGAGMIGLSILSVVNTKNPANIFISDLNESKLEIAKEMGAEYTINPSLKDSKMVIDDKVGERGIDVSIEAVGLTDTVQYSLSNLSQQGKCIFVGVFKKMVEINMHEIVGNELTIIGSTVYTMKDFGDAIDYLASREIKTDLFISKILPLEKGPEVFSELSEDLGTNIKVILNS